MTTIKLYFTNRDDVLPCPFCGQDEVEIGEPSDAPEDPDDGIALRNTYATASYWVECQSCGAEAHDNSGNTNSSDKRMRNHEKAKAAALKAWNRRDTR